MSSSGLTFFKTFSVCLFISENLYAFIYFVRHVDETHTNIRPKYKMSQLRARKCYVNTYTEATEHDLVTNIQHPSY